MIRFALLLAISSVHAACSAEPPTGNFIAAGNVNIAAGREADRGTKSTMTATQIVISSDQGRVTAELVDNQATRALLRVLPLTIDMRDHLRQEKTGNLPSPLPEVPRQTSFSAGTLGLWGNDDVVIYYRNGRVPAPGLSVLGRVKDVAIFDRPGPLTVRIERAD
jgi:hypothetical protein